jgi:peptidyl-prolyl cis-trans isomerase C
MTLRNLAVLALAAPALLISVQTLAQGTEEAAKGAPKSSAKGGAKKAGPKDAIARVNGVPVPKARMDAMVLQQQARGTPDSEQTRAMVREELINREIVAQEAAKSGLAKTPEVQMQIDSARQEILVGAYVRDWLRKHPISDAEIQQEYDRAKGQTGDQEYKARHILVETEDQAKAMIAELKKGAKFEELATKNSKDSGTKERGGDLDWNVPGVFDKQFSEAMAKLEKGKYTETPVRTRFGFHVIQLDDVRAVKFPSLAEVKPRIQQQLAQGKIEGLVRDLRAKAKIE